MTRIIFVPGNRNCTTQDNWFPSVQRELEEKGLDVVVAEGAVAKNIANMEGISDSETSIVTAA